MLLRQDEQHYRITRIRYDRMTDADDTPHPERLHTSEPFEPFCGAGGAQSPPVQGCTQLPDEGCSTGSSCGLRPLCCGAAPAGGDMFCRGGTVSPACASADS